MAPPRIVLVGLPSAAVSPTRPHASPYDNVDLFAHPRRTARKVPEVTAELEMVVEDADGGFCGAIVKIERDAVVLEDRDGRRRLFPMAPAAFQLEGKPVTLVRPLAPAARRAPERSASGSIRAPRAPARTAKAGRIWVEGRHDAELVERVWGHDLRVEGVVVEPLDGIDQLPERVAAFGPGPGRRLGVLVDHLVAGSKESRLVASLDQPDVLVTGHPYVDIWEAVRPEVLGIGRWPSVPPPTPWKDGVCRALGWIGSDGSPDPAEGWRRVLGMVSSFRDLEPALLGAMERLIDFVLD